MKDINNKEIKIGQSVVMPDPIYDSPYSDIHNHSFVGTVKAFHDEYVTVVDDDEDCFDVEPERLEIIEIIN